MDDLILITQLNDFIFCPISIYFHRIYGNQDKITYQSVSQINGTHAHNKIDEKEYTTSNKILMAREVYCEKYHLIGKIDMYDEEKHLLRERKKKIVRIYDGYVFQVYAQCFALREMGYSVDRIELYSMDDNKVFGVKLPEEDSDMLKKFEDTLCKIRKFSMEEFVQTNSEKCMRCIYEPLCDRSC